MKTDSKGFTLVELLIVVIILAILAAIVVPQFSSSTTDAKESALDANLGGSRRSRCASHSRCSGSRCSRKCR